MPIFVAIFLFARSFAVKCGGLLLDLQFICAASFDN